MADKDSTLRRPFAKRSLGQNFLADQNYIGKIVSSIELTSADTVVEIGPGHGALTELLVATGANVIAIELDRDLIPVLAEKFRECANFHLVEENAVLFDFITLAKTANSKLKLVANLPYYLSTAILQRLIDQRDAFSELVLMFQREVVDRMTAEPGDPERGFLSVIVEAFLDVKPLFDVPPTAFRPVPKVWSTVVRLIPSSACAASDEPLKVLISRGFRQPRKTIFNNLKGPYPNIERVLSACGVDAKLRPERLTQQQWMCISENLNEARPDTDKF